MRGLISELPRGVFLRDRENGRQVRLLCPQLAPAMGLPCVLIVCEKGKMGDTFPRSLRYYDLRLRYRLV